jgi:Animal haem peroxidase
LVGDPRNDENTIVAQLHLAFLLAHNKLVEQGKSFAAARATLRQHYQWIVLHDFLNRVCDPRIIARTINRGPKFYKALSEPFFLPLEFAVAGYRFGHSMVRRSYDFNVNFNTAGPPSVPATLALLFTFTALTGQLGFPGGNFDTLPENWIIEWEQFFPTGRNLARRVDTYLVEPLFELTNTLGQPETEGGDDAKRLAVRNLLRGYLLRMPTGQALAKAFGISPLSASALEAAADSSEQTQILRDSGFNKRTPLWYYILAEANAKAAASILDRWEAPFSRRCLLGWCNAATIRSCVGGAGSPVSVEGAVSLSCRICCGSQAFLGRRRPAALSRWRLSLKSDF